MAHNKSVSEYKPIRKENESNVTVKQKTVDALASKIYATVHKFKQTHKLNGSEILTALFQASYILTNEEA